MNIGNLIEGRASSDIVSCTVDQTMRDVVALLADRRIGALPVMEQGRVAGIFSERDVLYCLAKEGAAALDRPVRDVMTAEPITVQRNHSILGALGLMTDRRVRHLPVVEDGRLVGFISIGDLVKYRMDRIESDVAAMRDYIRST